MEKKLIKVLVADDHPLVMAGFTTSLADCGIEVVGQAKTPDEAVNLYSDLMPDVLVLDIRFGEKLTGLDAAKEILGKFPKANIVFLSQFDQIDLIREAYRIGALAFVKKNIGPADLSVAVTRANQGELYFQPLIAERLANLSVRGNDSPQSKLDSREIEIFIMMAQGLTNAEMAEKLNLSLKTISNASQGIKVKLGIHRIADITLLAVKYGYIEP